MDPFQHMQSRQSRQIFLSIGAASVGAAALASLLESSSDGAEEVAGAATDRWRGVINPPHHPPRAKRVIFLFLHNAFAWFCSDTLCTTSLSEPARPMRVSIRSPLKDSCGSTL